MNQLDGIGRQLIYGRNLGAKERRLVRNKTGQIGARLERHRFSEYENWGIKHRPGVTIPERGELERHLMEHNWRYLQFTPIERETFRARLTSINFGVLRSRVQSFVNREFGRYKIAGLAVFGGVLYGHESQTPDDLDLIVLLAGASFTANPVVMALPNMRHEAFSPQAPRPVTSGRVGLTLIGTGAIHSRSRDEYVRAFSLSFWGEAVPVYGALFCAEPPPAAAYLPFPYRVMAWAYKDLLMSQTDRSVAVRSLSRVITGVYIAKFVAGKLGLGNGTNLEPAVIWEQIIAFSDPQKLFELFTSLSRRLSQDLFRLECLIRARALARLEEVACR